MKKLGILLILLMFGICMIAGFKAAETYYQMQPTATPLAGRKDLQSQQTLFLLHVDQLKAPKPVLKSVWALFIYYSNTPSITFAPLYQRETTLGRILPLRDFSLSPEGDVSGAFLRALQKQYDLSTNHFIVFDDQSLITFGNHLGEKIFSSEIAAIETMCGLLQTSAGQNENLPWGKLVPDHFRTNVRFDLFQANWQRLTAGKNRPICEIIPGD